MNAVKTLSIAASGRNEKWLQDYIWNNPSQLGLGDEVVGKYKERIQSTGSRLDMLLIDKDADTMYEVEIMLGKVDESHIIRTIEYWEYERAKWPNMKHIAVLIAEEINSRFYNVIRLISNSIPIIGIQVNLVSVNGNDGLLFNKIVDTSEGPSVDDHGDTIQVTKEQFLKEYKFLWDSAMKVSEIAKENGIEFEPRHLANYVSIRMGEKDRLWIDPRKNKESCYATYAPDGKKAEVLDILNVIAYRIKESSENKIYFRINEESFTDHRDKIIRLLKIISQ